MNVLHAFSNYLNLSENWAYRLISNIPEVNTFITADEYRKTNFYDSNFEFVEFPLKYVDESIPLSKALNKIIAQLRKTNPQYVARILKGRSINVLHSHYGYSGWNHRKIADLLNIPHVISFYGWDYEKFTFLNPSWKPKYQKLFQIGDKFLAEGSHAKQLMVKIGCPEQKVDVIRLGGDIQSIPFQLRHRKSSNFRLVQIANLTGKKGHVYTIEAYALAKAKRSDISLTIIGNGPAAFKQELVSKARQLNVLEDIEFIDYVNFDHLHDLLLDYHAFIHPSCYTESLDSEGGAPVVLIDAQATGLPVISTTHCDIPDVVIHESTGFLSPEKNSEAVAESIVRLFDLSQSDYDQMSIKARSHMEDAYDISKNTQYLRGIYGQLLS